MTAAIFGALAVMLGAFGAHGLKTYVDGQQLENWKTGVSYQFYHTFALLALALLGPRDSAGNIAFITFTLGIVLFSGSLYLLSTRAVTGLSVSFLGPVTPLGGLMFIAGWISLFISAYKRL